MLFGLALRNVGRNARRSLVTLSSVAAGLAALVFLWAFIDGMNEQMADNTTRYSAGHVQVHLAGYHDDPSLDRAMNDVGPIAAALARRPEIAAAAARFEANALVSVGEKSRGALLIGVEPEAEARVTTLFEAVVVGAPLAPGEHMTVLIGDRMAEALGAAVGDELAVVAQANDGSLAAARFRVAGIFRTKIDELDSWTAYTTLAAAREFLAAPDGATAVAIRLRDRGATDGAVAALASELGARYEVLGWQRLLPMVIQSVRFHEVLGYAILLVLFVIVAVGITNAVLMAVLERTREFGVMLALGTRPSRLVLLVVTEALLIGAGGLVLGNAVGLALAAYFGARGIDLSAFARGMEIMPGLSDVIYPLPLGERSAMLSAIVLATTLGAALYPALKAAGLAPVAAIRGQEGSVRRRQAGRWSSTREARHVFLAIAVRSLRRNPRRSLLTIAGTTFSVAAFVFLLGFFDGFGDQMVQNATGYITGHLQLEPKGFRREMSVQLALDDPEALLRALRADPRVVAAAPRVQAQALVSSAAKQEMAVLVGVDPRAESRVTILARSVREGAPLAIGQDRSIVIGGKLAEKLRVRLGERIVVYAQSADGALGSAAYRVSGIFRTESDAFDARFAYVTIDAARALLGLGNKASVIGIRLDDRRATAAAQSALGPVAERAGYDLVSWRELLPEVDQMVMLNKAISAIVVAIVFAVVALGLLNTVLMSVMERTREFGVMLAIGTRPAAIVRVVLYETAMLVALGIAIGYAAGGAMVEYFGVRGLDLSYFFRDISRIPGLTGVIYTRVFVGTLAWPTAMLLAFSLAAALYPALRAARLEPVEAIRHG